MKNAARMTLYFDSEKLFFQKKHYLTLKQSYMFPVTLGNPEQNKSA